MSIICAIQFVDFIFPQYFSLMLASTNLSHLPYELKEQIAFRCEYWTYQKLRACDSVFNSFPACKIVSVGELQSLLKGVRLEKWEFGSDFEEWERKIWGRMANTGKPFTVDPKVIEFQQRIKLDLSRITQEQYLYVCRNALALEVCRIGKAVLLDPKKFAHIDLTAFNQSESNDEGFFYSLGFAIISSEVDLVADLLQVVGIDPSFDENSGIVMASFYGNAEIVQFLLQDPRVDPSAGNNCAIGAASQSGHVEVVRLLLQDPRVDPSVGNNAPIETASYFGRAGVVQLLLQDARVDPSAGENGAIRLASQNGHVEVVQLLLGDARVDPSAENNWTIRLASQNGHVEVVQLLLQDSRVDPSADNNWAIGAAS